jgi:pyruvate,orthophosphate dikinase
LARRCLIASSAVTSIPASSHIDAERKVGICGEHGGDPASINFCHNAGLDYVSCSPFRVPIARLAAAQAALNSKK